MSTTRPLFRLIQITLITALAAGCASIKPLVAARLSDPPQPKHEFRAIFVTAAWNIDWPKRQKLDPVDQIAEIDKIVGRAKELNCNVILLEVRAFGDRIHRHTTLATPEPWAAALNQGQDPDPLNRAYDPLGEWIRACHEKGIELHAWINAFRTDHVIGTLPFGPTPDGHHLLLDYRSERVQAYVLTVM